MEFFSRTSGGMSAEHLFKDVEYIICIEGKSDASDIEKIYDYRFYHGLLSALFDKPFQIKVKGCKQELLAIAQQLERDDVKNHIVIVDRDHDDIINHITPITICRGVIMFTHGYSWENDFWSTKLLTDIALFYGFNGHEVNEFIKSFKINERRFKIMHRLNLLSRVNGRKLFELKGWCGIAPQRKTPVGKIAFLISKNEVSQKVISKWKAFDCDGTAETVSAKTALTINGNSHEGFIIQGHSYEYLALELLSEFYNRYIPYATGSSPKPLFKSAALGFFIKNPMKYLSPKTVDHYRRSLSLLAP